MSRRHDTHEVDTEEVEDASWVRLIKYLTESAARQHHHRLWRPLQSVTGEIIERRTSCRVADEAAATAATADRLCQRVRRCTQQHDIQSATCTWSTTKQHHGTTNPAIDPFSFTQRTTQLVTLTSSNQSISQSMVYFILQYNCWISYKIWLKITDKRIHKSMLPNV